MVRTKDSFKYWFVDDDDDDYCFWLLILCWSMIDSMSDGLNTDDDTNDGLISDGIESDDDDEDERGDDSDDGQDNNNE